MQARDYNRTTEALLMGLEGTTFIVGHAILIMMMVITKQV